MREALGEPSQKTGWQVHAYGLMCNHIHLVLETPQPNLVAGMKWLLQPPAEHGPNPRSGQRLLGIWNLIN